MSDLEPTNISETKADFKVSWQFLKANYKAFISTELFAFLAFIIVFSIMVGILILVFYLSPNLTLVDLRPDNIGNADIKFRVYIIIPIIAYLVMVGFLSCQFGLAYDIFTSGDMFSEFKKSFVYFKNHWWKYMILTFVTGFSFFLPPNVLHIRTETSPWTTTDAIVIVFEILRYLVSFIILVIFVYTLPSVTAQGNLWNSLVESIRITKIEWKRIIKTWGLYFLIFLAPSLILSLTAHFTYPYVEGTVWYTVIIAMLILVQIFKLFIGFPLLSLIATRIYNSTKFERFKPLTKQESKTKTRKDEKSSIGSV